MLQIEIGTKMEGVYMCSSSERVINAEKELEKELHNLQHEIESGGIIGKTDVQSFRYKISI